MFHPRRALVAVTLLAPAPWAAAATITLNPAKDNTLFEQPESPATFSSGAGSILYIGRTGELDAGMLRRGLMAFNVAAALPANATVTSASLTLQVDRSGKAGGIQTVSLARVLSDWGEGPSVSSGGAGGGAAGADATWTHRFFNNAASAWATPGGDFAAEASAVGTLGLNGTYKIDGAQLAADVQEWLAHPATNFGWILRGDEVTLQSAKQIESREASTPPVLTVTYSVPEPGHLGALALGIYGVSCRRRRR